MDRFDRILGTGKQNKIKSSSRMPTRREGKDGDMMIVNGAFLIKDRNLWLKFSSSIETADGESSTNVTIVEQNYTVTNGLNHNSITNVSANQHHNEVHSLTSHNDVTTTTGTGAVVFGTTPSIATPAIAGGTIDNSVIGGSTAAAGSFSTIGASGTITANLVDAATVEGDVVKTPHIKAADATSAITIANSTGDVTIAGALNVTGAFNTYGGVAAVTDLNLQMASSQATLAGCNTAGVWWGTDGGVGALITFVWDNGNSKMVLNQNFDAVANTISTTGIVDAGQLDVDNITINGNTISSTDANGPITITPNGTGSVVMSKVDIGSGAIDGTAIGASSTSTGQFTTLTATTSNLGTLGSNVDHNNFNSTNVDIDSGDISGVTISGGLTWNAGQNLNNQNLTNVDIDNGTIDNTIIGGSTAVAGSFTTVDAATDFTIGGTVITDNTITDDGTLAISATNGVTIAIGSGATDDFKIDTTSLIVEGDTNNVGIGTYPTVGVRLDVQGNNNVPALVTIEAPTDHADSDVALTLVQASTTKGVFGYDDELDCVTLAYGTGTTATTGLQIASDGDVTILGQIELGHASDTTLKRWNGGDVTIEGKVIYRKDCGLSGEGPVQVADGGTNVTSFIDKAVLCSQDTDTDTVVAKNMAFNGAVLIGSTSGGPEPNYINGGQEFQKGINVINGGNTIDIEIALGDGAVLATGPCLQFYGEKLEVKVNQLEIRKRLLKEDTGLAIDEEIEPQWIGLHEFRTGAFVGENRTDFEGVKNALSNHTDNYYPYMGEIRDGRGRAFTYAIDAYRGCYSGIAYGQLTNNADANYNDW